jgi:hypothetical protein
MQKRRELQCFESLRVFHVAPVGKFIDRGVPGHCIKFDRTIFWVRFASSISRTVKTIHRPH